MILTSNRPQLRNSQGFTLLELVVVSAILAILVGAVGMAFFGQRGKAKEDRARADLQVIQQGLEAYKARFGDYPRRPSTASATDDLSDAEYLLNALCGQIGPLGHDISGQGIPVMLNTSLLTYFTTGLPLSGIRNNHIVDPWGKAYVYDDEPKNEAKELLFGYDLRSIGPDGDPKKTEDDIVAE